MDKDIQKMFKEKNKEILITNLKYDLDKNVGSLMETIINIYNLAFDDAIKTIDTIFIDANIIDGTKFITETINVIKLDSFSDLDTFINEKKNIVLNNIKNLKFTEEKMDEYYDMLLDTTKLLKEKLHKELKTILSKTNSDLTDYVSKIVESDKLDLISSRLDDYLNNRLYEKLETKVHMEIMLRDNSLINKAKEGYLRYQEICSKTLV